MMFDEAAFPAGWASTKDLVQRADTSVGTGILGSALQILAKVVAKLALVCKPTLPGRKLGRHSPAGTKLDGLFEAAIRASDVLTTLLLVLSALAMGGHRCEGGCVIRSLRSVAILRSAFAGLLCVTVTTICILGVT